MRVHPLLAGEILVARRFISCGPGLRGQLRGMADQARRHDAHWAPVPVFLLEHPTEGPVVVDTGYAADAAVNPRRTLGAAASLFDHRPYDLTALLAQAGVAPGDVGTVVMTHFHNDHASGLERFEGATVVADRAEWVAASRGGLGLSSGGYVPPMIRALRRRVMLDFDGPLAHPLGPLPRTIDLFGDGRIVLISTPGHSPGHQSVLVRLGSGREVLLTGDAADTRRLLEHPGPTTSMSDRAAFLTSAQRLRSHVRLHPDTVVIPGHDAGVWPTLPPVLE